MRKKSLENKKGILEVKEKGDKTLRWSVPENVLSLFSHSTLSG